MKLRRLSFAMGAEVSGIDISRPLSPSAARDIRDAWLENQILLFRDLSLTAEQHIAFSRSLGELELHPIDAYRTESHPEIIRVTNIASNGTPSLTRREGRQWHTDGIFTTRPPTGSLLYCHQVPDLAGDTMFANMYLAYDELSPSLKSRLEGLEAVHLVFASFSSANLLSKDPAFIAAQRKKTPAVAQPLIRVHPETGRKALYYSKSALFIVGWTDEESKPLLDFLFQHATMPEFTYRHRWRPGDMILWDNRCALHKALGDLTDDQPRLMTRTTLVGDPCGYLYQDAVRPG